VRSELQLGEALSEVTLASELGVSKTPMHGALLQLEPEGLVDIQPRHGTFVFKMGSRQVSYLNAFSDWGCWGQAVPHTLPFPQTTRFSSQSAHSRRMMGLGGRGVSYQPPFEMTGSTSLAEPENLMMAEADSGHLKGRLVSVCFATWGIAAVRFRTLNEITSPPQAFQQLR